MSHTPCNNSSLANLLPFFCSCNRFIACPGVVVEAGNAPREGRSLDKKALLLILLSVFIYASSFGAKIVVYDAKGRNDSTEDCDGFTDYDSNRDAAGLHDSAKQLTFVHHSFALRCRQGHIRKCGGRGRQRATSCRFIGLYLAASTRVLSAKYAGALRRAWRGIGHGLVCPCFGASGICRQLGRDVVVKGWDSFGKCTKSFFCLDVLLFVRFGRSPLSSGWLFGEVLCLWLHSVFRHGVLSGLELRACPERLPRAAGAVWPGGYFFVSSHKS